MFVDTDWPVVLVSCLVTAGLETNAFLQEVLDVSRLSELRRHPDNREN